ncbi:MAG TPA: zinc ribbon domain-containing protein [Galbitalea sp.]|jgi:hypothetical protein
MKTCVGCGAQLDPTWKYCIHCGLAVSLRELVPAGTAAPAGASHSSERQDETPHPKSGRAGNIALLIGGITAFLIAVALTAIAIAYAVGALK